MILSNNFFPLTKQLYIVTQNCTDYSISWDYSNGVLNHGWWRKSEEFNKENIEMFPNINLFKEFFYRVLFKEENDFQYKILDSNGKIIHLINSNKELNEYFITH